MSAVRINSTPFKGEVGRGMGFLAAISSIKPLFAPHPHPIPSNRKRRFRDLPLEGEGEDVHAICSVLSIDDGTIMARLFYSLVSIG
ncbi:MAG: hypothetical protein KA779_09615 [Propionivibrio sp.]|jgi:hypothetical protein|nr:hypothetical protein [Propionivibrio sp.]MBP7525006.1 hypothetical protein [Propionivibrio sp.]